MNDVFLGIIAFAVLTMAVIQVGAIVFALLAARRFGRLADRIERELAPIVTNLQTITGEAAKATTLAAGRVEKIDEFVGEVSKRTEEILASVAEILSHASQGVGFASGLKALLRVVRGFRRSSRRRRARTEDEDALFIG